MAQSLVSRLGALFGLEARDQNRALQARLAAQAKVVVPWREQYAILRRYYESNGLYAALQEALKESEIWTPAMQPLRNPTFRIVEFYASHLWAGPLDEALPIEAENQDVVEPIQQVWQWSNWGAKKQVAARWLSLYGDLFIKVSSDIPDRVYFQLLDPGIVTDLDSDPRGFLTYIRLDVDVPPEKVGARNLVYTEIWDKGLGTFRTWMNEAKSEIIPFDELGTPTLEVGILEHFGFDFIPIAHGKFRDVGDDRGQAAVMPIIDKVDEANRQATRLAQLMFRYNKPVWMLIANAVDKDGRPVGGPRLVDRDGTTVNGATLRIGDDTLLEIPGQGELKSLVPDLKYEAYLQLLQDTMREIEEDAPEMGFAKLFETVGGDMSGRAIRLKLAPAIKRVEEARGNGEEVIARADMMAITMAQQLGMREFDVGLFENGDLDHQFKKRDVWPVSEGEEAEAETAKATAVQTKVTAGWSFEKAMEEAGYNDDDIQLMVEQRRQVDTTLNTEQ
jgi:hypothetical protein